MASDDVMAILYLLSRPDVSIRAITISGTGETHCEPGVRNALGLVALAGKADIPVACGREKPLQGDTEFPAAWRAGVEKIRGVTLPKGGEPSGAQRGGVDRPGNPGLTREGVRADARTAHQPGRSAPGPA